jgi:hypothetical protein
MNVSIITFRARIKRRSNIVSRTQCPEERRTESRKKSNKRTWASKVWREARDNFLLTNPRCAYCKSPSRVPHHPHLEVYGRPEYLELSETVALCITCHRGFHAQRFQCPKCRKISSKSEGDICYGCLPRSDRERAIYREEHLQRERNKINSDKSRRAYTAKKEYQKKTIANARKILSGSVKDA